MNGYSKQVAVVRLRGAQPIRHPPPSFIRFAHQSLRSCLGHRDSQGLACNRRTISSSSRLPSQQRSALPLKGGLFQSPLQGSTLRSGGRGVATRSSQCAQPINPLPALRRDVPLLKGNILLAAYKTMLKYVIRPAKEHVIRQPPKKTGRRNRSPDGPETQLRLDP